MDHRRHPSPLAPWLGGLLVVVGLGACGPSSSGEGNNTGMNDDSGVNHNDGGVHPGVDAFVFVDAAEPNWDAFFANDPPPAYCGPDGGAGPVLPGGTPDCPDDKNREGCPCTTPNAQAPCWPGLRVDRNRGICHDGITTCVPWNEFGGRWGPCEGYVLPDPGVTSGPGACNCFSAGQWQIDNLSPCFVTYNGSDVFAVSTFMNGASASCPTSISPTPPPQPEPGTDWSANRLTVDCSGVFQLCYVLRAGDENAPNPTDCEVARACVDVWYDTPDQTMELAPLPSWTSSNSSCAGQFASTGGYGEMTVIGLSIECDNIDDGSGSAYVFHRVGYCPLECNTNPTLPECANCGNGGSGSF